MQISDTNGSRCEDGKSSLQFISSPRAETHGCLAIETCLQTQFSGKISDLRFKKRTGQLKKKKNYMYFLPLKTPQRLTVRAIRKLWDVSIFWVRVPVMWGDALGSHAHFQATAMALALLKPRLGSPGWSRQAALSSISVSVTQERLQGADLQGDPVPPRQEPFVDTRVGTVDAQMALAAGEAAVLAACGSPLQPLLGLGRLLLFCQQIRILLPATLISRNIQEVCFVLAGGSVCLARLAGGSIVQGTGQGQVPHQDADPVAGLIAGQSGSLQEAADRCLSLSF